MKKEILIDKDFVILRVDDNEYKDSIEEFVSKIAFQIVNSAKFDEYLTFFFFVVKEDVAIEWIKEEFNDSSEIEGLNNVLKTLMPKIKKKIVQILKEQNDYRLSVLKYHLFYKIKWRKI